MEGLPFKGYLLYAYGIDGPEIRSGGEPSAAGDLQQSDGKKLTIRRSGGMELEIKGNYNRLGWDLSIRDDQWWKATNQQNVQADFYSVVHHEVGHALIFNANNPKFKRAGVLQDEAIRAYLGTDVTLDKTDHLDGIIDPASLRGGFGNEYHGKTPYGRWLITTLDLLVAQAVGYKLRQVDSQVPFGMVTKALPAATVRKAYSAVLRAQGGIPYYDWTVTAGKLPAGLTLDRFTGEISGVPTAAGSSSFTVSAREYTKGAAPATCAMTLVVGA